ncbi:antibiotic biosynthesis monooxygenase [Paenibacillus pasadenensis]|uniref:Antibiotic biosynthesis monooxygenase domain-containing protein n=1 Tax=Paenibacillus pasadenensis TaxID=217090 RepID=A0A2N5N6N8_9BACL|nr:MULTISPECIES: antibiotic biosynthesis monooxygenase [Paenibacillus]PLT46014.1 Antibiotic biosynthesis monooxygenase domain-containing protein [Paenibacillus pasadenensis]QGG56502.1 antibiotic biosynthesis monooxygenase [Paenibacillus sp. B01]
MLVIQRRIKVKEGHAAQVVERFSKPGPVQEFDGFVDIQILQKVVRRGEEEVIVQIRWESEQAWKNWEKSDVHIQGHRNSRGQEKPDYVLETEVSRYELAAVKEPIRKGT